MSNHIFISDLHAPYVHPDAIDFIKAWQSHLGPKETKMISLGDWADIHSVSFHNQHPECYGPAQEFELAQQFHDEQLVPLGVEFICRSNHGDRPYRIARDAGLPDKVMKPIQEIWNSPIEFGDKWVGKIGGVNTIAHHGHGLGAKKYYARAQAQYPYNSITGHFHTDLGIVFYTLPTGESFWSASGGCLIDAASPAFSYANFQPALGMIVVEDDLPYVAKMFTDKRGRWTGKIV